MRPVRLMIFAVVALNLLGRSALAAEALTWFEAGRPSVAAGQLVQVLQQASDHGLEPQDYHASELARGLVRAQEGAVLSSESQVQFDRALTQSLLRYLSDLKLGRVTPQQLRAKFVAAPPEPWQPPILAGQAMSPQRLTALLQQAQPRLPMYQDLRQALQRYRELASHPAWQTTLPPLPGRKLVAGQTYSGLGVLAQRLQALGDLSPTSTLPERFEGQLVSALQAFQQRHGLEPDGVLGQDTWQQLQVTPLSRVRQIALTLERLRWTPLLQAPRMVVVNVPEFVLRAYEVHDAQVDVKLSMKVIVGKALDTRTPLLQEDMRFIEFSPFWNVPASIARKELVPRLRRNPGYFEQQGFEFVTASGQVARTLSDAHLAAVIAGSWRIRQRPGERNALGDIKFIFPNNDNIYLHHTPSIQLFERARRDFSHGCIRIEDPVGLAQFVLQDDPTWTRERIEQAMRKGSSSTLRLSQPLPVLIAYSTVVVEHGRVFFYPDLYGHDRLLEQVLRQRSDAVTPWPMPNFDQK